MKAFFVDNPPKGLPAAGVEKIGKVLWKIALLGMLAGCAPKPTDEKVDLSKIRSRLALTDGSSVSLDDYDDINPVLIRMPDESLVLVFESDRPCAEGCDGSYNLFIAQSEEPYYGADIPAFYEPVAVNASGSAHNISPGRFNFQATYGQGSIFILLDDGVTGINFITVPEPAIPSGDSGGPPLPIPNAIRQTDSLVHLDTRSFRMISKDTSDNLYLSRIADMTDSGTLIFNDDLAFANSAARVVPDISGFTDAVLYESFGSLAYGWHDSPGNDMQSFNDALDREGLELSYVSVLHMFLPSTELLLFSAGEPGSLHDLYAVDSHTLEELWLQDAFPGFIFQNTDDFSIFQTSGSPSLNGDLKAAGGGATGIKGADNICNTDLAQPDINVYYKAMIVDGAGTRRACTSGNCATLGAAEHVDWVLQPNASYYQAAGRTKIDTANSRGLLPGPAAVGMVSNTWTGLTATWLTDLSNHCSNWTNGSTGNGAIGDGTSTGTGIIFLNNTTGCSTFGEVLYCVEQP